MKCSRTLALGFTVFGATTLVLSRLMIANLPAHTTGSMATGVAGFWNLFLDLITGALNIGGYALGVVPLVVGLLGLVVSCFSAPSLPLVGEGPTSLALEEKWEYLPQEGRGKTKLAGDAVGATKTDAGTGPNDGSLPTLQNFL